MDLSLFISIIALLIALSKWIYDYWKPPERQQRSHNRRGRARGRVELLTGQTNCFVTHGGYILFLLSFRIYNDDDQVPLHIQRCQLEVRQGWRWHPTVIYKTSLAAMFPGLVRNSVPVRVEASDTQDFYEVFQYDDLLPTTSTQVRLICEAREGIRLRCKEELHHRTDDRPVFDILFRPWDDSDTGKR